MVVRKRSHVPVHEPRVRDEELGGRDVRKMQYLAEVGLRGQPSLRAAVGCIEHRLHESGRRGGSAVSGRRYLCVVMLVETSELVEERDRQLVLGGVVRNPLLHETQPATAPARTLSTHPEQLKTTPGRRTV